MVSILFVFPARSLPQMKLPATSMVIPISYGTLAMEECILLSLSHEVCVETKCRVPDLGRKLISTSSVRWKFRPAVIPSLLLQPSFNIPRQIQSPSPSYLVANLQSLRRTFALDRKRTFDSSSPRELTPRAQFQTTTSVGRRAPQESEQLQDSEPLAHQRPLMLEGVHGSLVRKHTLN